MNTIAVVDANNILHALYHAMGAHHAAAAWLRNLAAICGYIAGGDRPRVYVAFDGDRGTAWRRDLVPEYKSGRKEKAADLVELLRGAAVASTDLGYETFNVTDAEADDVIAAVVTRHASERAVIVSSDRDLYQLLEPGRVSQLRDYKVSAGKLDKCVWYTAADFATAYGIRPEQWPAWRAIAGDKSDGLGGVPGCGPDAATAILSRFATLAEATADQWQLPCNARQRIAMMAAARGGHLERFERVCTLRRDCLDLAFSEGGSV